MSMWKQAKVLRTAWQMVGYTKKLMTRAAHDADAAHVVAERLLLQLDGQLH